MTSGAEPFPRFGRQRAPHEVAALILLFIGFSALAVAFWLLNSSVLGTLLPISFVIGAWQSLRGDVREIEVRGDTLILKTFLRAYPIPRAHITSIVRMPLDTSIQVLNGRRYGVTPPEVSPVVVANALEDWLVS